jgi:hypothetical protein
MADKNIVRMEDKNVSGEEKFADFLDANRKLLVGFLCLVIAAIVAYAVAFNVKSSLVKKILVRLRLLNIRLQRMPLIWMRLLLTAAVRRRSAISDPILKRAELPVPARI